MNIVAAIQLYYPDWDPPRDNGKDWIKCLCPFHGEENPSAAVSYKLDAFNCLGCSVKGDAISIIRSQEGVNYSEAVRISTSIPLGGSTRLPTQPARKPSRRVPFESGPDRAAGSPVRPGVRGRTPPWS